MIDACREADVKLMATVGSNAFGRLSPGTEVEVRTRYEGRWASAHPNAIKVLDQAREIVDIERRRRHYADFLKVSRDEGPFMLPFFVNELNGNWGYVRDYRLGAASSDMILDDVWLSSEAPKKKG